MCYLWHADWLEIEWLDREVMRPTVDHDGFDYDNDADIDALWMERGGELCEYDPSA